MTADAKRTPVATASAQTSASPRSSINGDPTLGLSLPPSLERRLRALESRIDVGCVMACRGEGCSFACPVSLPTAITEVLRDAGGAA